MAQGTLFAICVVLIAFVYADDLSPPPYDRYNFYDISDPYNFVFAIDGGVAKQLNDVDDWSSGFGPGSGVLDCYAPGIFDNSDCQLSPTLFHNPCGKGAILLCDTMGDGGADDIYGPYDFARNDPLSFGRTLGATPIEFDITRAMVYNKRYGKTDFLAIGLEYTPWKTDRTFVFEFNTKVVNFTMENDSVPIFNSLRERGDLIIFVHSKRHLGFKVEVYYLQHGGPYYSKKDLVFEKHFESHQGTCREPTFFAGSFNDKIVPAAPWGGVLSVGISKDVNEPYSFFEAKIDLNPIKEKYGGYIRTNWVTVRSMDPTESALDNCKLRDNLGPAHFKLDHENDDFKYYRDDHYAKKPW